MKISLKWINRYLSAPVNADAAAAVLAAQGFPVESRTDLSDGDVRLDVEVTSNRSDCLSHLGVAREVAAGTGCVLNPPPLDLPTGNATPIDTLTAIENQTPATCPLYTARVICGVKVGPSPDWLRTAVEAVGLRSVNNIVDVTNFVLMETGQPLHAFDLDKLTGRRIVVRMARPGETFVAIDASRHELSAKMMVIADAERAVAVAGVMGGLNTEVDGSTTNVLLESARFDPVSIRSTSRRLKLASDSSYRFERGVDPRGVDAASRRAAALIVEVAGGGLADGILREGEPDPQPLTVTLRRSRCDLLLGTALEAGAIEGYLARLGFAPRWDAAQAVVTVTVPSWRCDVTREVDLIEEVARMHGLDRVPTRSRIEIDVRPPQPGVQGRRELAGVLVAHGYHETVTATFLGVDAAGAFLPADHHGLQVSDDRRRAELMLRPALLPSLLLCRKSNQDVGNEAVRLFEVAAVFMARGEQIIERRRLALLADAAQPADALRSLRGTIEELVQRLGGDARLTFVPSQAPQYDQMSEVRLNDQVIGAAGLLSAKVQKQFDLQTTMVAAELDVDPLLALYPPRRVVQALVRLPGIERDLSVIVAESLSWDAVRSEVLAAAPAILEQLTFVTTYRGKPVPPGSKSLTMRLRFRDPQGTLRHDEVDPHMAAITERLKSNCSAALREG